MGLPLRIFLIEPQTEYLWFKCELPKGPSIDRSKPTACAGSQLPHHWEVLRTAGFHMWLCQQLHQTWHALPSPLSLQFLEGFSLLISSSTQLAGPPGPLHPGNTERRRCWPRATPVDPHTEELSASTCFPTPRRGCNQT